jgi:hypothetical protein
MRQGGKMAKKLKLYEKAGRVIRLMAWISGISVLAIAAAVMPAVLGRTGVTV